MIPNHPHLKAADSAAHRHSLPFGADTEFCVSRQTAAKGGDRDKANRFVNREKVSCWTVYLFLIFINDK